LRARNTTPQTQLAKQKVRCISFHYTGIAPVKTVMVLRGYISKNRVMPIHGYVHNSCACSDIHTTLVYSPVVVNDIHLYKTNQRWHSPMSHFNCSCYYSWFVIYDVFRYDYLPSS